MTRTQTLIPSSTLIKDAGLVMGGAALTATLAQISIHMEPVPFTLQPLSVIVCGLALGARRGAASQIAYLAAGAAGLPVFAGGRAGLTALLGTTGGFLFSFVLCAALLGFLAERGWDRKVLPCAAAMTLANIVMFACGWAWLSNFIGGQKALLAGVVPFIPGNIAQSVIATMALPLAWKIVGEKRN